MASGNASSVSPTAPVGNTVVLPAGILVVTFIFPVGREWLVRVACRRLVLDEYSDSWQLHWDLFYVHGRLWQAGRRRRYGQSLQRSLRPCPGRTGDPLLFPVGRVGRY